MTFPKESVERIELLAAPERERDGTEREVPIETVPVAVRLARERLPEMRPLPWTERIWVGEVVPRPRLPEVSMRARSEPLALNKILPPVDVRLRLLAPLDTFRVKTFDQRLASAPMS